MALSPAQLPVLKAAIEADQELDALENTPDNAFAIAAAFNVDASPAFVVWRVRVDMEEIMRGGLDWARVDNLTAGKARIWDYMGRLGWFDPSEPGIRSGIDAAWVGTAPDLAVRAYVYTKCKELASRAEKLYATGVGTEANTATRGFVGDVTYLDVLAARNLP